MSAAGLLALGAAFLLISGALGAASVRKVADALALVDLAAVLGVYAVRGNARRVVGLLVILAGVADFGFLFNPDGPRTASGWAGLAATATVMAGYFVVRHGKSWPSMSSRYEREARAASRPPTAWEAIDRGEDPTA